MRAAVVLAVLVACARAEAPVASAHPDPGGPFPGPLPPASAVQASPAPPLAPIVTSSGLEIDDLRPGTGAEARSGDTVAVHYVGTLADGTEFDSSRRRGRSFVFTLGAHNVIKGWEEGVLGMREGQLRRLRIPPDLAYGPSGRPPKIPGGATLVFEIELLNVQ